MSARAEAAGKDGVEPGDESVRLIEYLDTEALARKNSFEVFRPELKIADELLEFYVGFLDTLSIGDGVGIAIAHLYLDVSDQLCGAVSQLLNRTLSRSRGCVRRAIEAAGIARRLAEEPTLFAVLVNTYPNANNVGTPTQFLPSREYRKAFRTTETLRGDAHPWPYLRSMYAVHSMSAAHPGMGSFSGHKQVEVVYKRFSSRSI